MMEVQPKGSEVPLKIYEIGGIGGVYTVVLENTPTELQLLEEEIPVRCRLLTESGSFAKETTGRIVGLSRTAAQASFQEKLDLFSNLQMNLLQGSEELCRRAFYVKVVGYEKFDSDIHILRFAGVPPIIKGYFEGIIEYGTRSRV
jgi:hypothetical protein